MSAIEVIPDILYELLEPLRIGANLSGFHPFFPGRKQRVGRAAVVKLDVDFATPSSMSDANPAHGGRRDSRGRVLLAL